MQHIYTCCKLFGVVGGWEEEELYVRVLQGEAQVYFDCQTHSLGIPKTTSPNKLVPSFFIYIYICVCEFIYIYIYWESVSERESIHCSCGLSFCLSLFGPKPMFRQALATLYIQIVGLYVYVINQMDITRYHSLDDRLQGTTIIITVLTRRFAVNRFMTCLTQPSDIS